MSTFTYNSPYKYSFGSSRTLSNEKPKTLPITSSSSTTFAALKQQNQLSPISQPFLPISFTNATTDVLHAEVDYNVNEIDNIMICKGKLIEIESGNLSSKHGLIAKCLFINKLLIEANLSDQKLNTDPKFKPEESKAMIKFNTDEDAEEFLNSHNSRFRIIVKNSSKTDIDDYKNEIEPSYTHLNQQSIEHSKSSLSKSKPLEKKSITFGVDNKNTDYGLNSTNFTSSQFNNNRNTSESFNNNNNTNSISSKTIFGIRDNESYSSSNEKNEMTSTVARANSVKDLQIVDGYETLTIRAKLKQRVGSNRTKHVTLRDIDSIMRNVVTVVQDEFMKQFPSATSVQQTALTNGENGD